MNRAQALSRRVHIVGAIVGIAVPVAAACGGEIANPSQSDGGMPSSTATGTTTTAPTATTSPAPASSLCDGNGQSTQDASTCSVSFTQTIFELYMAPQGEWACSNASCHGTGTPNAPITALNAPTLDAYDAHAAYVSLTTTSLEGFPYVNACSTDSTTSAFPCNLTGACSPKMPQAGGGVSPMIPVSDHSLADLNTWLACGAPFN